MSAPLTARDHVVVVGAGLAGWRTCEALRRQGFDGTLSLVGDEAELPYDRPPLSKQILAGKWTPERAALANSTRLEELAVHAHLGSAATGLDSESCTVTLSNGTQLSGTRVVIATGTRARTLPYSATSGLFTLRKLHDAQQLSARVDTIEPGSQVVVVGGGFVGAEVATSLQARGLAPVVLEALSRPLLSVVGPEVSQWLVPLVSAGEVELRTNQKILDVVDDGDGNRVLLDNGTSLEAAFVVVAVGAIANTEWLVDADIALDNGVSVDDHLLATATVGAVGDVAKFTWRHDPFVDEVRMEHWDVANAHAPAMATTLLLGRDSSPPVQIVPYFWSDQYGKKIQMLGHPRPDDDVVRVSGSDKEGKWLAMYSREDVVTGFVALNQPRALMVSRGLLQPHATRREALTSAPWRS